MRKIFLTLLLAALPLLASADEGMWLINMIEGKLHRQMADAGLRLDAKTIYDEDRASLSDAVVALAFGCSGSMISNDGLMITNHHCAYEVLPAGIVPKSVATLSPKASVLSPPLS